MKNFDAFSKALSDSFNIPIEIFDFNRSEHFSSEDGNDYYLSEAYELTASSSFEFYQYIKRYDEGWGCVRLYIDKLQIKKVLNFILEYHKELFSEEDLLPVKTTLEIGKGHFAMPDETESLSYLEGVFDEGQAFIEVARVIA
ncbi:hypothetical protein [Marinilabilia rubra]|uniref:Uncharacterized protein n=1 Tax=Marinilabilia rubra TaxID=2162893 RepID=A0A2U2B790_9BACT|nr:hypothetical protein [Marinilabilia rubra]PWD98904.1 hypothetical protein DDZ16_12960 [Marinilabilia rubra]